MTEIKELRTNLEESNINLNQRAEELQSVTANFEKLNNESEHSLVGTFGFKTMQLKYYLENHGIQRAHAE